MAVALELTRFAEVGDADRFPDELKAVYERLRLDFLEPDSDLRIDVRSLGRNWWLGELNSRGAVKMSLRGAASAGVGDYAALGVMLSGRKSSFDGGIKMPSRAGEVALERYVAPDTPLESKLLLTGESRYVEVFIPRAELEADCGDGALAYGATRPAFRGISALLVSVIRSLVSETDIHMDEFGDDIHEVIKRLIFATFKDVSGPAEPADAANKISHIMAYIHANAGNPRLTSPQVAKYCGVSTRQLHRLFHAQDRSFLSTLRELRLDMAAKRLAAPEFATCSIEKIATECGFASSAHFSRTFRRSYEASPREFRRERCGGLAAGGQEGRARP
jgi:AraC-like DNA-binding protein